MIRAAIRYLIFILVGAALVYAGYRMMTPATTKTVATEKSEKEEHSDSIILSDAKLETAGIELAKAEAGVLRDNLLLNGAVQPIKSRWSRSHHAFQASFATSASESAIRCRRVMSLRQLKVTRA